MRDIIEDNPAEKPRGLTLAFVHTFVDRHGGRDAFEKLTTADVCFKLVLPWTGTTKLSLVDHVAQDPTYGSAYVQPAQWFVSHSWSYRFLDVVDALDYFFAENGLDDTTAFWFCMFNNNQHEIQDNERDSAYWFDIFYNSLVSIGKVVMVMSPWKNPETLTRMWCVFEVYASILAHARFEVALGKTQKEEFLQEIVQADNAFLQMLASIKSESSRTTVAADREFIQAKIRADVGNPNQAAKHFASNASQEALGEIHLTNRRLVQAKDYYTLADQIWRREKAPDMWRTQCYIAVAMADNEEAREDWEPLFQESLHHQQAELGPDNRNTVETMANCGVALQTAGDYAQAVELLTRAFETRERTCGSGDKLAIECLATLGQTLSHQRKYAQVTMWLERAYMQSCLVFGTDHKNSLLTRSHLGIVYGMQNRFQDCLNMLLESYNSSARTFGRDHLDTWQVLSKCAMVYCALGQYAESERVLLECQDKFKRVLGHDSEWYIKCQRDLGKLYYCQKHFEKAAPLTEMAYQALLGHNNPLILHTIYDMYLVKLEMQALETLDDLAALEEVLEKADCTDEIWK
ncbi:unnamed protein product, partial [Aphanomyces euteiches]